MKYLSYVSIYIFTALLLLNGCARLFPKTSYYQPLNISRSISSVEQRQQTIDPKRVIEEVHPESTREQMLKLTNAKIVIADYDLIRRDFPELKELDNPSIDKWILDNFAYMSVPQTETEKFNTPIPLERSNEITAYRPPEYGRAAVFEAPNPFADNSMGLIDIKGTGGVRERLVNDKLKGHQNGLATLGESIREFLYENMMRKVLNDANVKNKTVGSYFVLDAGFDIRWEDGSTSPAGIYARQAHKRYTTRKVNGRLTGNGWLDPDQRTMFIELFKQYGIDPEYNVQGTVDNDLFDFGHYIVREDMEGIKANKQIPFNMWGYPKEAVNPNGERWYLSREDYPWLWSHQLADDFAHGRADRDAVWRHYQNFLVPVEEKLQTTERPRNRVISLKKWKPNIDFNCKDAANSFFRNLFGR